MSNRIHVLSTSFSLNEYLWFFLILLVFSFCTPFKHFVINSQGSQFWTLFYLLLWSFFWPCWLSSDFYFLFSPLHSSVIPLLNPWCLSTHLCQLFKSSSRHQVMSKGGWGRNPTCPEDFSSCSKHWRINDLDVFDLGEWRQQIYWTMRIVISFHICKYTHTHTHTHTHTRVYSRNMHVITSLLIFVSPFIFAFIFSFSSLVFMTSEIKCVSQ